MGIFPVNIPQANFVYNPQLTRRRFLHTAFSMPIAATLLPSLLPSHASGAGVQVSDIIPEHELRFTTRNGKDPGHKVVIVFMQGGLSFFDTFDPKTHSSIAGPFKPIDTACSDIKVTDILNPIARHMNNAVVVNNLYGGDGFHHVGGAIVFTSSPKVEGSDFYSPTPNTNPFVEFSRTLTKQATKDVGYVVLHQNTKDIHGDDRLFRSPWDAVKSGDPETIYSAYDTNTGAFTNPFNDTDGIPINELRARLELLDQMEAINGHKLVGASVDKHRKSYEKARSLLGGDFYKSFDLNNESPEEIIKYGDSKVGKQLLLARRMLQRGARIVVANDGNYDHHGGLENNMRLMIPPFAQALSALLDDINRMNEKVYVVMVTEFGRTPGYEVDRDVETGEPLYKAAGRQHWTNAFGMVVFGNDIKKGKLIGQTNNKGEIVGDAYHASMVGETILELMGIGRFKKRGDFVTSERFPFIDVRNL